MPLVAPCAVRGEAALTAHGRADRVLFIRVWGGLTFAVLLPLIGSIGASAAAIATAAASLVMRVQLGLSVANLGGRSRPIYSAATGASGAIVE